MDMNTAAPAPLKPTPEGECPRIGQYKDMPLLGVPGVSLRILFVGPKVGQSYSQDMLALSSTKELQEMADGQPVAGAFVDKFFGFARGVLTSLAIGVNGVRGYKPDDPAEVQPFLDIINYEQAADLLTKALTYQMPNLKVFTRG